MANNRAGSKPKANNGNSKSQGKPKGNNVTDINKNKNQPKEGNNVDTNNIQTPVVPVAEANSANEEIAASGADAHSEGQLAVNDSGEISTDANQSSAEMLEDTKNKQMIPFERKTQLQKSSVSRTMKSLFKDWKKGVLNFKLAIQRGEAWTPEQRSNLIRSMLYGFPVPPVYVMEGEDKVQYFLDGKQRVNFAVMPFIDGQYALHKKTKPIFGHNIAGMKFKDLPEDMQETLLDETIQLIKMENMTDDERDTMFVNLNSGSSLSKIELTRAMHSELIERINAISDMPFFKDKIVLSKKARNGFVDQEIILQIAMLLEDGKEKLKGFGAKEIRDFVLRLKESEQTISDEMMATFASVTNYLSEAVGGLDAVEVKKTMKKVNVPILFHVAQQAIERNVHADLFAEFIRSFLITNYSVESDYGQASQSGSSKKDAVLLRLHEMTRAFDKFVTKMKDASNTFKAVEEYNNELSSEIAGQAVANSEKGLIAAGSEDEDEEN